MNILSQAKIKCYSDQGTLGVVVRHCIHNQKSRVQACANKQKETVIIYSETLENNLEKRRRKQGIQ